MSADACDKRIVISRIQGLCSLILFVQRYQEKYGFDSDSILLSGLPLLHDNITADPAFSSEWNDAVDKNISQKQCQGIITPKQAFKAMVSFFEDFNSRGPDKNIIHLLKLAGSKKDDPIRSELWPHWICSIEKVLSVPAGTIPDECRFKLIHN